LPASVSTPEFLGWDNARRIDYRRRKARAVATNRRRIEDRSKFQMVTDEAKRFANRTIWTPWVCDWRSRAYPSTGALSLQGGELAKSLHRFAEAEKMTERGEWWTLVALAGAAGHDKLPLSERVQWADSHRAVILESATNPWGAGFWMEQKEPFRFLAYAQDLRDGLTRTPWQSTVALPGFKCSPRCLATWTPRWRPTSCRRLSVATCTQK
jgi:DNA-directed RNA polymerase